MILEVPVRGVFDENCYFLVDNASKRAMVIDPGAEGDRLLDLTVRNGWIVEMIALTHGHFDHTGGVETLRRAIGVPVFASRNADVYLLDPEMNLSANYGMPIVVPDAQKVAEGEILSLGTPSSLRVRVIETPGHTADSVVYYCEEAGAAFVGDTIFEGSPGTHLYPGGNPRDLRQSIAEKIFALPGETLLFSGHTPKTTVAAERARYRL